jgi:von Willebrand factor type A C-terminal domain/von Willebrand factor type A domain
MTAFSAEVHQNEYLPRGWPVVHAIVTISAREVEGDGSSPAASGPQAVEVIMLDCSSSMGSPPSKIETAITATRKAIDRLRDGTWFAIIAGTSHARLVYPEPEADPEGETFVPILARASWATRAQAKAAVMRLSPNGGTRISTWLALARQLFESQPSAIQHAMLLADGKNEHEEASALAAELERCVGKFQCDCRGVGTAWDRAELQGISDTLLGTTDIITDPSEMAAAFEAIMTEAMSKRVGSVLLSALTPVGGEVSFLRQVSPELLDLTDKVAWQQPAGPDGEWLGVTAVDPAKPLISVYPVGAWGNGEEREYHVCLSVVPQDVGVHNEVRAARMSLVTDSGTAFSVPVRAVWTEDEERATRINRLVAHFTGQEELAKSIEEGLEAKRAGDYATATYKLGRAAQLAHETGNEGTIRLLERVVDIEDASTGTVRLREAVAKEDEMTLDARSRKTVRLRKPEEP